MIKEYSFVKRALLRELSQDSRVSVTNLSKKLKCARNTIISNMEAIEKEFGLTYTIEFNKQKLGLNQNQMWHIKFGTQPKMGEIKSVFKDDDFVQFVAETDGDFDLLVNIVADSSEEYVSWGIKTVLKLIPYHPVIKSSIIAMVHTGYIPLNDAVLEKIDLSVFNLDELDRKILILLNGNARMTQSAMADKLDEDVETIRYRMKKILKTKIINRFTLVLQNPPTEYNMAFFIDHGLAPGIIERYNKAREYYLGMDSNLPIINNLQYLALTSGASFIFGIGCFETEEKAIKDGILAHRELYKEDNPTIHFAKITKIAKGHLPIRSINLPKEFRPFKWTR